MAEEASVKEQQKSKAALGGDVQLTGAADGAVRNTNGMTMAVAEETEVKGDAPLYVRRRKAVLIACCGSLTCLVVLLGLVILILSFTLFKFREPEISISQVQVGSLTLPSSLSITDLNLNLSLSVGVSVYNPNHASFRYSNSTSFMYYRELTVGEAPIPAGKIGARATEMLHTTLRLNASGSLLLEPHLFSDLTAGSFPISTSALIFGRVNVLNIFKHHARATSLCTMFIDILSRSISNTTCNSHVKIL